jgi:hypothetical protein
MARATIFPITVALIAGTAGCVNTGGGGDAYYLAIASTAGGSVIIPGEWTCWYDAKTMVDLVAEREEHYDFVNWTGDVGTIANVHAASTTVIMKGDYSITAKFELDPGWCSLSVSSPWGGSVATPGEGSFVYRNSTVVDLAAQPDDGYQSFKWTGNVDTTTDVSDAATDITMGDSYSITANFG